MESVQWEGKTIGVGFPRLRRRTSSRTWWSNITAVILRRPGEVDPGARFRRSAFDRPQGRHHRRDDRRAAVDFEAKRMGFNIISRAGDIFRFPYNGLAAGMKKLAERPEMR